MEAFFLRNHMASVPRWCYYFLFHKLISSFCFYVSILDFICHHNSFPLISSTFSFITSFYLVLFFPTFIPFPFRCLSTCVTYHLSLSVHLYNVRIYSFCLQVEPRSGAIRHSFVLSLSILPPFPTHSHSLLSKWCLTEGEKRGWSHIQKDKGELRHHPHKRDSYLQLSSGEMCVNKRGEREKYERKLWNNAKWQFV
jgi:hypothetical protein